LQYLNSGGVKSPPAKWLRLIGKLLSATIFFRGLMIGFTVAQAATPEELWKSLKKLPPAERENELIVGAKKEGEMLWYTNSGIENATRYIQAFKKDSSGSSVKKYSPRRTRRDRREEDLTAKSAKNLGFRSAGQPSCGYPYQCYGGHEVLIHKYPNPSCPS